MKHTLFSLTQRAKVTFLIAAMSSCWAGAQTINHYYEGASARAITLDPHWVADINVMGSSAQQQPRATGASPTASELVTLRPADAPVAKTSGGQTSPVYREGNSPAGRAMALPGGVLIKFQPDWTDQQVHAWAAAKGLTIVQRLNITGNWYTVATAAGNASIELANSLQQAGEVLAASPNWWKQTITR